MNILVIDCGTTSIRGVIFSGDGQLLHMLRIHDPLIIDGEYIEQDAAVYGQAVRDICSDAAPFNIGAIAVTAFRSAVALFDENCDPLCRFIMWQDARNNSICQRLSGESALVREKCGADINTVFAGTKLTWLKENRPTLWQCTYKAMTVADYLIHCLTGNFVTDRTYGSRTLLMDLHTGQWDGQLCELFSIEPEKLCRLTVPGSVAGYLTESAAALTGLDSGIPIITAGGDQQCAALGLGLLREGVAALNCGTGAYALTLSGKPVCDRSDIICGVSAIPDKYILETSIPSCATALNAFLRDNYPEAGGDMSLLDRDVESGSGSRAEKARQLYIDLADKLSACAARLPCFMPGDSDLYLSGGVSSSRIFNTILQQKTGCRLIRWGNPESTAIGAFSSASFTLGLFPDIESALAAARKNDIQEIFAI